MKDKGKLITALSGAFAVGFSLFFGYLLLRSRLNGIGWVSLMEPNDLILFVELGIMIPFIVVSGLYTIHNQLWGSKDDKPEV